MTAADPVCMDLWDLHQSMSIRSMQQSQVYQQAESDIRNSRQEQRSERLDDRFERLLLMCEAMWSLLSERVGVNEADLVARMTELDQRDGALDGQSRRAPQRCTACGAAISREFAKCLYCGEPAPVQDAFGRI